MGSIDEDKERYSRHVGNFDPPDDVTPSLEPPDDALLTDDDGPSEPEEPEGPEEPTL